ncbi:MAG: FAD-dependent monooxygenase [Proteobacteria bacterium]|nr:FAD-dependent monooxygenase [Pseudomonadota bacterium]
MESDLIIIGAGLVGASLLAALKNSGFRIIVLESHIPISTQTQPDSRPLTINECSRRILETLGIWSTLQPWAEPIKTVHISEQNRFGTLRFKAAEENLAALGYVVPCDQLQNQLCRKGTENPAVKFVPLQKLLHIELEPDQEVQVTVQTQQGVLTVAAKLLVIADGAHSLARQMLNIDVVKPLDQHKGIIFTVEFSQPHPPICYERFTNQGIIAVLPLKNPLRCRIVWVASDKLMAEMQHWSDQRWCDQLQQVFHGRLKNCTMVDRGSVFPLETVLAKQQIKPGAVLLGNAAHTLYPLAAQGFNLGLRDAAALAEILVAAKKNQQSIGDLQVLKQYQDWRTADQRWITGLTLGISYLFEAPLPGLGMFRAGGLLATDLFEPLKRRLAKRFLGLSGKLPKLARGISL